MYQFTRRVLVRIGSVAASLPALSVTLPEPLSAAADPMSPTVFHVFLFKWKPATTQAMKQKAATDIAGFQGQIPGLVETHIGKNVSPHGRDYTFGGVMRFKDQNALDAYVTHPAHQVLLAWLMPLIDAIELDLPT